MRPLVNASVNTSAEASVAVLVGPLVTFVPSGTFVGLGGGMVDTFAEPYEMFVEIGTNDWEKQRKEGE